MSGAAHEVINLGDLPEERFDTNHPPPSAQTRPQTGEANFVDGSEPLFSMYVEMTGEEDKRMAESWKADADGILVFTGLFSASVAALVAVSVQDLKPSSQDNSAFYLANIYQLLANANGIQVSIPATLTDPSIPFSPPSHAVWVNSLWFLSLAISITCALLATLLQQWARRYIKITQPRYSPHKRARIRAFFAEGVDKLHLPWAVEALPTLLHVSLFLFFGGLLMFLFNINHTVFSAVAWWVGICAAVYIWVTFMPIFRHDSPYYAPLSSTVWFLVTGTSFILFRVLLHLSFFKHRSSSHLRALMERHRTLLLQGLGKAAEETARTPSPGIDRRALTWIFESLDEDHELERFFSSLPSFCSSTVVSNPLGTFIKPNEEKLLWALIGLMDRTSSSNLVHNSVKQRRSSICVRAMDAASLPLNQHIFMRVFAEEWDGLLSSVEFGLFLSKVTHDDPVASSYSLCAVSIIITRVNDHDDRWFDLTTGHLGISGLVLRDYLAHGDSVLLANLIYTIRHMVDIHSSHTLTRTPTSRSKTFQSISKLDIRDTLPGLQHDFCALWNEIVLLARSARDPRTQFNHVFMLKHVYEMYALLHQGTGSFPTAFSASTDFDNPILNLSSSYPLCTVESHRHAFSEQNLVPSVSGVIASGTAEDIAPLLIPPSSTPHHDTTTRITDPPSTGPDAQLSSFQSADLSTIHHHPPSDASKSHDTSSGNGSASPKAFSPIITSSHPASLESYLPSTSLNSAPLVYESSASITEGAADTSLMIVSAANFFPHSLASGARSISYPISAPTNTLPSDPQLAPPAPQYGIGFTSVSSTSSTAFLFPSTYLSDPYVASNVEVLSPHENIHDLNPATPIQPPAHPPQTEPSFSNVVMDPLAPYDGVARSVKDRERPANMKS